MRRLKITRLVSAPEKDGLKHRITGSTLNPERLSSFFNSASLRSLCVCGYACVLYISQETNESDIEGRAGLQVIESSNGFPGGD